MGVTSFGEQLLKEKGIKFLGGKGLFLWGGRGLGKIDFNLLFWS
jgi:hypothetical protein